MQSQRCAAPKRAAGSAAAQSGSGLAAARGAPLAPELRADFEPRFRHDFSRVRVHADAPAAAAARRLAAAAFTLDQDIYFAAGRYRPESYAGRALLAHELAHVVQGIPDRILRQRAEPGEEPALYAARLRVIQQAGDQIPILLGALDQGYLFGKDFGPVEELIQGGVRTNYRLTAMNAAESIAPIEETFARRETRLRQLISDLARLSALLEAGALPADWFDAPHSSTKPCTITDLDNLRRGPSANRNVDLYILYACYAHRIGRSDSDIFFNSIFVWDVPIKAPRVQRRPVSRATETGIYLVVPDPENAPMKYQRLTGKTGWQGKGVVVTVWSDDAGYFYYGKDRRHYLPERP